MPNDPDETAAEPVPTESISPVSFADELDELDPRCIAPIEHWLEPNRRAR